MSEKILNQIKSYNNESKQIRQLYFPDLSPFPLLFPSLPFLLYLILSSLLFSSICPLQFSFLLFFFLLISPFLRSPLPNVTDIQTTVASFMTAYTPRRKTQDFDSTKLEKVIWYKMIFSRP